MEFSGKVCVITGGANGIGRCMVEELDIARMAMYLCGEQASFITVENFTVDACLI